MALVSWRSLCVSVCVCLNRRCLEEMPHLSMTKGFLIDGGGKNSSRLENLYKITHNFPSSDAHSTGSTWKGLWSENGKENRKSEATHRLQAWTISFLTLIINFPLQFFCWMPINNYSEVIKRIWALRSGKEGHWDSGYCSSPQPLLTFVTCLTRFPFKLKPWQSLQFLSVA